MNTWVLGKEGSHMVVHVVSRRVWNGSDFVCSQKFTHCPDRVSKCIFMAKKPILIILFFRLFCPVFPQML
jgi:hypothetical protein